jgi:3-deoxy-D-manno-octulosonic-acid transferase
MRLLYNTGVQLYFIAIYFVSFFNKKARLWVKGRKNQSFIRCEYSIWFHFASLGEFEQGRPVLERMRALYPENKIIITFFSPSGYRVRKDTPLADAVYYLPLDTQKNAANFLDTINPRFAVFTKYEYWYHFFNETHQRQIPLYVISGIFRPKQIFFKWYGSLHRQMLTFVTCFFVQDENSRQLLQTLNITNVKISGDTRFDRVWENAQQPKKIPAIEEFKNGKKLFIAGSTWPDDEKFLVKLVYQYPDWKFIFAPHEVENEKIKKLLSLLPAQETIRYSKIATLAPHLSSMKYMVIDNVGMLLSLYQYADIAYLGGGFGAGIHNTLEAAAFGLPVIFGPNYERFKEAKDLIKHKAGFSINNEKQLNDITALLIKDNDFYAFAADKARAYVQGNIGATQMIADYIKSRNV